MLSIVMDPIIPIIVFPKRKWNTVVVEIQNGHEVQQDGNMQKRSNNSLNENENERKEEKKKLIKQRLLPCS